MRAYFVVGGATKSAVSSANVPFVAFQSYWIRATRIAATGVVTFYTSPDGVTWTQLGTTVSTTSGNISTGTSEVEISGYTSHTGGAFSGIVYRAQIYNGIAGTLVFDADFTAQAKGTTSFAESSANAATVTVNQSGDTAARICGARDLFQFTSSKKPILTTGAVNYATFDGINDFLKAAPFSLSQPITVFFVGSQSSWNNATYITDGNSSTERGLVIEQFGSSPALRIYAGTSDVAANTDLAVNTRGVICAVFSGASSSLRVNKGTASTGNPGAQSANGVTVASSYAGGSPGNITVSEILIFSAALDTATQLKVASYLIRKWQVSA